MIEKYVSPAEFRRLVSGLLAVLGFISLAALFAFIVVPGLRYQAHTTGEAPVQAVRSETGWLDPTDYPAAPKEILPPLDPRTVMTPNPELMARGRALYDQTCASCHGTGGRGDGPSGRTLVPRPRDFTSKAGWKNGTRIEGVYKTLEEGIKGSPMVAYEYLRRKDRMALVHVVRAFGTFGHEPSDPLALAALEKLFSSAGEVIPNRIPVREAEARLLQEYRPVPALQGWAEDPLLRAAILDPAKAARTLSGIPGWSSSEETLAEGLVAGLPGNGFAPEIALLAPARWRALRLALTRAGESR